MKTPWKRQYVRLALGLLMAGLATGSRPFDLRAAEVDVTAVEHVRPALPVIPERTFRLTDFGAVGDGTTLNTEAFARAIAAVAKAGGGKLVVPAGTFRTGPFALCSSLELHLEAGALIQAPATFADWGLPEPTTFSSQAEVNAAVKPVPPLIHGRKLHDVAITGSGQIDGNGALWWAWSERAARAQRGRLVYKRTHMIIIDGCERLRVADVTLSNSAMFHLVPRRITDLTIERVKVRAPEEAPNTDAIDPGSVTNAWIHHCDIDTGDDNIVIKSGGTNILIEDCVIKHGHGISIGSETTEGVRNMLVRRCSFDGTDNGIRIKSMRGAGGVVENIRYTGITMKDVENAIVLDLTYTDNNRPNFRGDPTKIPVIRDILIDHVTVTGSLKAGKIVGLPDSPISGVTLRDVTIQAEKDLVVKDAGAPVFERVTRQIEPGVAPRKPAYVH
ncbi:glycoside hydrolase family 28 protein [Opitutus terrae]|nr:glycosyl hydrolase family 28 protein [Opitutus terrae]